MTRTFDNDLITKMAEAILNSDNKSAIDAIDHLADRLGISFEVREAMDELTIHAANSYEYSLHG